MSGKPIHGLARTREYKIWVGIIMRCENPRASGYSHYGGRGITVCERWRNDVAAFVADMGRRPSPKHSIDRIDNDGNYEPGNCRWATPKEQSSNRRATVRVNLDGVTLVLGDAARALGIGAQALHARIRKGQSGDELKRPPWRPKLTADDIATIKRSSEPPSVVCARYGISQGTYFRVREVPGRRPGRPRGSAREFVRGGMA